MLFQNLYRSFPERSAHFPSNLCLLICPSFRAFPAHLSSGSLNALTPLFPQVPFRFRVDPTCLSGTFSLNAPTLTPFERTLLVSRADPTHPRSPSLVFADPAHPEWIPHSPLVSSPSRISFTLVNTLSRFQVSPASDALTPPSPLNPGGSDSPPISTHPERILPTSRTSRCPLVHLRSLL